MRSERRVMLAYASIQKTTRLAGLSREKPAVQMATTRKLRSRAALSERIYSVYIMASRRNGTLYIGVTNNLAIRAHQHRTGVGSSFTMKYGVKMLVWYEHYRDVNEAIAREKQLKGWNRKWKLALIEQLNREWRDLYEVLNA